MYHRARKVAQELRKVRASRELSRAITTHQPAKLHKSCARSEQAENCHEPSQRIRQRCTDVVPVKLAVMSSVITMHQESINLYISRWLPAATQQMNIKQYIYIALCILYIFVTLALRVAELAAGLLSASYTYKSIEVVGYNRGKQHQYRLWTH